MNAVVKALQLYSPDPARVWAVRLPGNGSNSNVSADVNGAADVTQIFDHNGYPI